MTVNANQASIRRVVAGVDGSQSALHAALWAAEEAESRGVPLLLEHALHLPEAVAAPFEPDDFCARRQTAGGVLLEAMAAQIRERHPGLVVETEASLLSPIHRLVELSADEALIVTGTRGHGGFAGMLLGSVSRALATHAHGPLVVVRGPQPEQASGTVLLGVGPTSAESAVAFAFAAARTYGTSLRVLRVWQPPMPMATLGLPGSEAFALAGPGPLVMPQARDDDEGQAADAARTIAPVRRQYPDVEVEITARAGNVVPALTAASAGTRLIVIGAHRHRGPFAVGAGYAVEGLLANTPVPVAVIPVHQAGEER